MGAVRIQVVTVAAVDDDDGLEEADDGDVGDGYEVVAVVGGDVVVAEVVGGGDVDEHDGFDDVPSEEDC